MGNKFLEDEDMQKIHKKHKTDILGMVMDYQHKRLSSSELMDLIVSYCEMSYKLGRKSNNDK